MERTWKLGLVALHAARTEFGNEHLALRSPCNRFLLVAHEGAWDSLPTLAWCCRPKSWGDPVWVGTLFEYEDLKARAQSPTQLLREARKATQGPVATPDRSLMDLLAEERAEHAITLEAYDASRAKCADLEARIQSLRTQLKNAEDRGDRWCEAHSRLSEKMNALRDALRGLLT